MVVSGYLHMIGPRLKEERERIGLTQEAFSEAAGGKRRTLIDWEKGVSSPTAVQLSALSRIGVDVLYVVTGQRQGQTQSQSQAPTESATVTSLPPSELQTWKQMLAIVLDAAYRARRPLQADVVTNIVDSLMALQQPGRSVTDSAVAELMQRVK
jgi:transcriptional regulator with XRE-family HTH domain